MTSPRPAFRRLAAASIAWMLVAAAAAATGDAPSAPTPAQAAASTRERAIFAVSDADPQKWNLTLGNIANAIDGFGTSGVEIELVVYGPGIAMLRKDSPVAAKLAMALKSGVRIAACQNSMRGFNLQATDLVPGAEPVPSGVVELIRRQHAGYAYVRS